MSCYREIFKYSYEPPPPTPPAKSCSFSIIRTKSLKANQIWEINKNQSIAAEVYSQIKMDTGSQKKWVISLQKCHSYCVHNINSVWEYQSQFLQSREFEQFKATLFLLRIYLG